MGYAIISLEKIDMHELVMDCFEEIRLSSHVENIELTLYQIPDLIADRFLIRQAIFNIFSNSVKFSKAGQKLVITVGYIQKDNKITYYFKGQRYWV